MRALITGICGQDGSFLAESLLEKGYTVFGMKRPIEKDENIRHIIDRIHLLKGDLSDEKDVKNAIIESDPDEVYNLGALSHVGYSFKEPVEVGDVTGLAVVRLLEAIKNYNPRIKFYQASTSELFGNVNICPQSETTPMHPTSPYAIAKHYAYQMVKMYRDAYGLFAVNGILFNHESPRRPASFVTRKITTAVAEIKKGKKKDKLILGNTESMRDWGYAKEYVEAMWLMMKQKTPKDYVIGTGKMHSVKDFLVEAFEYADLDCKEWVETSDEFKRPSDVNMLQADASKARKELKWEPRTDFKALVRLMVDEDLKRIK